MIQKSSLATFLRYNVVGLINTLITLVVVWVLHNQLDWDLHLSNGLGYVVGAANSFVMNRIFTFRSKNHPGSELLRFLAVFAFAYVLNLGVLQAGLALLNGFPELTLLAARITKPTFLVHIAANVVYVLASFGLYKMWVFRKPTKT